MKKSTLLLYALLISCCVGNLALLYLHFGDRAAAEEEVGRYLVYIGINDKDTMHPVYTVDEAIDIVNGINFKYTDGFTVVPALGYWKSEEGREFEEESLLYIYYGIAEDRLYGIVDEVIAALNQESVLIDAGWGDVGFYP